ncbi:hypothetical protein Fmac_013594 [Flemingia macrophylla]|uniref:RING-type E3 ubiquitin transferase n=1 Tax=Flemingia macrophylla TaxID=520843 RepID=A0ABD1MTK5_9FABA
MSGCVSAGNSRRYNPAIGMGNSWSDSNSNSDRNRVTSVLLLLSPMQLAFLFGLHPMPMPIFYFLRRTMQERALLGFFELDHLSRLSPEDDEFPLCICAETISNSALDATPHMQITQSFLEKSNVINPFSVKLVRQLLWINDVPYELRELYGMGSSTATDFDDNDF